MRRTNTSVWGFVVAAIATSSAFGQATVDVLLTGDGNVTNMTASSRPIHEGTDFSPSPEQGTAFDLRLDSPDDIYFIEATLNVTSGAFYDPDGCFSEHVDCSPIPREIVELILSDLFVTSYVVTPGTTDFPKTGFLSTGREDRFSDSTNDPNQVGFQFARITLVPDENGYAEATFFGEIQTAGAAGGPELNQFSVTMSFGAVPEPGGMGIVCSAMLCLGILRRRVCRNLEVS